MENNEQKFSMEEYNKFLKQIKVGSPVHKINFSLESPNAIVGMYLITKEDGSKKYLDKFVDKSEINNDTLLVFESRHVIECCQIIYGILNVLKGIGMYRLDYKTFINEVIDTTLSKPSYYTTVINELINIANNCIHADDSRKAAVIYDNFEYILKNIWFVPYGQIDAMAEEAIEEFKKNTGVTDNE